MQRSFLTRTLICVIPTLIATALVVWAYLQDPVNLSGFKRGIDLSGGTILVYEVDRTATATTQGAGGDPGQGGAPPKAGGAAPVGRGGGGPPPPFPAPRPERPAVHLQERGAAVPVG